MEKNVAKTPLKTQNLGLALKSKIVPHAKIRKLNHGLIFDQALGSTRIALKSLSMSEILN